MKAAVGEHTALYGLVCGPLTLASHLRGTEIFMDMFDNPDYCHALLAYATRRGRANERPVHRCRHGRHRRWSTRWSRRSRRAHFTAYPQRTVQRAVQRHARQQDAYSRLVRVRRRHQEHRSHVPDRARIRSAVDENIDMLAGQADHRPLQYHPWRQHPADDA